MISSEAANLRRRLVAISASLALGLGLMAIKFVAYYLTDSAAILSDALESIINVVAASFALWSIIFAARSPDPSHPYGHGKIEYFSAGFEGALIILAALG
ncbi:MAG TPA: cation transporter, partial [Desulfobaccales bacterium]